MQSPQLIIQKKRNGSALSRDEIEQFVHGVTTGCVEDSQIAAFAMAVYFQGMTLDERVAFTLAMRDSGRVLDWSEAPLEGSLKGALDGPLIDKHSTGGVGDVVSLVLGPLLAACGGRVPMVSGRGLGHTGGTVDKLESIPNYNTQPSLTQFQEIVRDVGVAIVGQTDDIAPADRRIYAVRDVTATVESIDLITASILSKKLAAGLDALVMDVKVGSGAFMNSRDDSEKLAASIVEVACGAGTKTTAVLTDMNQCLASTAGNALEVSEAVALLRGEVLSQRLLQVTMTLGSELLVSSGISPSLPEALAELNRALDSGKATECFGRMVAALGGPSDFVENADQHLERATIVQPIFPQESGFAAAIDVRKLGVAVIALGGGRTRTGQAINHAVGLQDVLPLGEATDGERPLAIIHAHDQPTWLEAAELVRSAYEISERATTPPDLIQGVVRP